jgi:chromosome segregation ATPase
MNEEIEQLDADLARLRREATEVREQIGDRDGEGPTDSAELAAMLSNVEQLESLIETLEARREKLLG